jgi:hypothetical protein
MQNNELCKYYSGYCLDNDTNDLRLYYIDWYLYCIIYKCGKSGYKKSS